MPLTTIIFGLLVFNAHAQWFEFLDASDQTRFREFSEDFLTHSKVLPWFAATWNDADSRQKLIDPTQSMDTVEQKTMLVDYFLEELKKEEGLFQTLEGGMLPYLQKKDMDGFIKDEGSRVLRESFSLENLLPEIDKRMLACARSHNYENAWFLNKESFDKYVHTFLKEHIGSHYTRLGVEAFIKMTLSTCMCLASDPTVQDYSIKRKAQMDAMKSGETFEMFLKEEFRKNRDHRATVWYEAYMRLNLLQDELGLSINKIRFLFTEDGSFTMPEWFASLAHFDGHILTIPNKFQNLHKFSVHGGDFTGVDSCAVHDLLHISHLGAWSILLEAQYCSVNKTHSVLSTLARVMLQNTQSVWDAGGRSDLHWYILIMFHVLHEEMTAPLPCEDWPLSGFKRVLCSMREIYDAGMITATCTLLGQTKHSMNDTITEFFYTKELEFFPELWDKVKQAVQPKNLYHREIEAAKIYAVGKRIASTSDLQSLLKSFVLNLNLDDDEQRAIMKLTCWCFLGSKNNGKIEKFKAFLCKKEELDGYYYGYDYFDTVVQELARYLREKKGDVSALMEELLKDTPTPSKVVSGQDFSKICCILTDNPIILTHYDTASGHILVCVPKDDRSAASSPTYKCSILKILEILIRGKEMSHLCSDVLWKEHLDWVQQILNSILHSTIYEEPSIYGLLPNIVVPV